MSKLLNQTKPNMLATGGTEADYILSAAKEEAGFDKLLKCRKGEYSIGEVPVPLGTEFIAHPEGWTKCWIKFVDGVVVDRKVYRVAYGERPPEREDLGDLDQDKWPEGLDGSPADPWVYQYFLPLEDSANGEIVIFVTSSAGGRRAVADLCSAYAKRVSKNANCGQAIVKLAKADMPTKKFGKVPRPYFEIVGWDDKADGETPPAIESEDEFADEIPF